MKAWPGFCAAFVAGLIATSTAGAEPSLPSGSTLTVAGSGSVEVRTSTDAPEGTASSTVAPAADSGAQVRRHRRETPNLDGRAPPPPGAADVLLWVPRVLLSPLHLVLEWGVRKPLGAVLTVAERDGWAEILVDFFTFNERKIGVVPTFFFDYNFRPSVGLYFFWNELFVEPHSLQMTLGYGGDDWYRLTVLDRWRVSQSAELNLTFNVWGRPDHVFSGLGLDGDPDNRSRYFREIVDGRAQLIARPWRQSELRLEAGVRTNRFRDGSPDSGEVTLSEGVRRGLFATPAGFEEGYTSSFQQLLVRVDSRAPRPAPGSGALIESYLLHAWNLEQSGQEWMGYGGQLGAFIDLGRQRVVGVTGQAHLVNPIGGGEIPFTENFILARRPQDLSGFLPGTLMGRSAGVLTVEYSYPIWIFLDSALQYSVGNAFGANFEDFSFGALRSSLGLGVKAAPNSATNLTGEPDNALTFLVAVGTSRFDEPFTIDSFRLVFGTQTGF